jgi:diguanylate cyclase (GGDEF)-like protein/PAS domain S-box-containing protein
VSIPALLFVDHTAQGHLVEAALGRCGCEILARDPDAARAVLAARPAPCLIVIAAGGPAAEELCRRARSLAPEGRHTILAVTAGGGPGHFRALIAAGADDWLLVPPEAPLDPELLDLRLALAVRRLAAAAGSGGGDDPLARDETFRRMIETLSEGLGVKDEEGRITYVNARLCQMLGYSREEMIGRPVTDFFDAENLIRELRLAPEHLDAAASYEIEMTTRDGRQIPTLQSPKALYDRAGRPAGSFAVVADLTAHKQVEKELRLTQFLVDHAADAAFWADPEARFFYANETACAALEYSRDELLSLHVQDILRPQDANLFAEIARAVRAQGPVTFETVHVTRSGRQLPVEVTLNCLEWSGREFFCAFARDITERTEVEQALRESEERYRSLFDGVPIGLYRTTPEGRMLDANAALVEVLGFPGRQSLLEFDVNALYLDPEVRHHWQRELESEGEVRTFEAQLRRYDGRVIWARFSLHAFRDAEKRILRYEGALEDITDRKHAEEALRASEERFRSLVQNATDLIGILEESGAIRYESPSHERLLGHRPEDFAGKIFLDLVHPQDRRQVTDALRGLVEQPGEIVTLEYRRRHRDGEWRFFESTASNLLGHPAVAGIVLNSHDITDRKKAEERLLYETLHDELTGLPNRVLFMDRLKQAMERSRREPERITVVLFLDVDRFKIVNDSLGHLVGDELLIQVAGSLLSVLRPTDTIARMGGDEFAILLEGVRDVADAEEVAVRIHQRLATPINLHGHEIFLSASIGIAIHTPEYDGPEGLLRDADTAMYRAKSQGPAGHVVFNRGMHQFVMARLQLETDLRRALERGQIEVHYQPVVDLRTGAVTSLEALLRWAHPRHGILFPDEFLSVAEETGLIVQMGRYVLSEACRKVRELQERYPEHAALKLSVNLSNKQFFQADLLEQVRHALVDSGLHPSCLGLEITEGVIIQHAESANTRFSRLKSLGIQLSMDDFGKGYSSLNYLHRFQMDILKIDRSFVSRIEEGSGNLAILEAIVTLAHQLGMEVVAEGIQTAAQVRKIRALGCEYGQGFLFSKPLPAGEIENLLAPAAPVAAAGWRTVPDLP